MNGCVGGWMVGRLLGYIYFTLILHLPRTMAGEVLITFPWSITIFGHKTCFGQQPRPFITSMVKTMGVRVAGDSY